MKFSKGKNSVFFEGLNGRIKDKLSPGSKPGFATAETWVKAIILLTFYFGGYAMIYIFQRQYFLCLAGFLLMGLSGVMLVFNLVHDASHEALSPNRKVNKIFRYLGDFLGINTYIWDIRHNVQHHSFTNVLGGDIIIENIPLLRLSPGQPKKGFHSLQAYYAPFLYCFYTLYWMFVIDFRLFFKKEICNLRNLKHPAREWAILIFFKSLYILYALVFPILFTSIPAGQIFLFFFTMHFIGGILLSLVAVLGHYVNGPSFPEPENGLLDNSWSEHELEATIDFAPNSKIINWITGGLNTHVAHHLYPKMCHAHYFKLTPIIRDYCRENGYEYKEESLLGALSSHFNHLKKMGAK